MCGYRSAAYRTFRGGTLFGALEAVVRRRRRCGNSVVRALDAAAGSRREARYLALVARYFFDFREATDEACGSRRKAHYTALAALGSVDVRKAIDAVYGSRRGARPGC